MRQYYLICVYVLLLKTALQDATKLKKLRKFSESLRNDSDHLTRHHRFSKLEKVVCDRLGDCKNQPDAELSDAAWRRNTKSVSSRSGKMRSLDDTRWSRRLNLRSESAEESTDDIFQSTTFSPNSQKKLKLLGNRENVNAEFRKRLQQKTPKPKTEAEMNAIRHSKEMESRTECRIPTPKIKKVNVMYPHPRMEYDPSCTIIHECSEDSGCCSKGRRCEPLKIENVTLYFRVIPNGGVPYVETLSFENHTECHCRVIEELLPHDSPVSTNALQTEEDNSARCKCPYPFSTRNMNDGNCTCDCFDQDNYCLWYKKGKENLQPVDKECVSENKCAKPMCEYGSYSIRKGSCPKYNSFINYY